jgi:hypothetical protein
MKKASTKPNPLADALKASFVSPPPAHTPEPAISSAKEEPKPVAPAPAATKPRVQAKAKVEPVPVARGVVKTTVSYYPGDMEVIDEILDLLYQARRKRGGISDAMKIALRLCKPSAESVGRVFDTLKEDDLRRTKS